MLCKGGAGTACSSLLTGVTGVSKGKERMLDPPRYEAQAGHSNTASSLKATYREGFESVSSNKNKNNNSNAISTQQNLTKVPYDGLENIRVSCHNINGLKNNSTKIERLIEWSIENQIDIIGLAETNITSREGYFMVPNSTDYASFWANANKEKKKGSGVGILVSRKWEQYLGKVHRENEYFIEVIFYLKQLIIRVMMIYIPPNDKTQARKVQQLVIKRLANKTPETEIIVMGDFNHVVDETLDKQKKYSHQNKRPLPLHTWLINYDCIDTFRKINPKIKKFTWSGQDQKTRIDQIWISNALLTGLLNSDIEEMDVVTGSDHSLVRVDISVTHLISSMNKSNNKRKGYKRTIYLYDKADPDTWEKYARDLQRFLERRASVIGLVGAKSNTESRSTDINQIWDSIANGIVMAANQNIPKKTFVSSRINKHKPKSTKKSILYQCTVLLSKIVRKASKWKETFFDAQDVASWNKTLNWISEMQDIEIECYTNQDMCSWVEDIRGWWQILNRKLAAERKQEESRRIEKFTNERCEMIRNKQGRMLMSLLEKPYQKIKIDRLLIEENGKTHLITHPEEVLSKTRAFFQRQFIQGTKEIINSKEALEWRTYLEPLNSVQESWYDGIKEEVSLDEWLEVLSEVKKNTAPGLSGIDYTLIRKANLTTQEIFCKFVNLCLQTGEVPDKWKVAQIYLIPKGSDWEFNLNNVRPIALLETFRKCITRVFTKRLSRILVKKNILKGPNFAGLPGDSTETPVHILNSIMEYAKEEKKELWLLFQDMSKAFDSVPLHMLSIALRRIKLPESAISFIINLFQERKIKVITEVGLTEEIQASRSIDQGEVISPLMWRIFYDPLLCRIQEDPSLGFNLVHKEITDLGRMQFKRWEVKQAVIAYADDTTWITRDQETLEKTIQLAEQFYRINNIKVNANKSKLVVLNSPVTQPEVKFGDSTIQAEEKSKLTRFLGVWICSNMKESSIRNKAKFITKQLIQVLKLKRVTISQLSYINNAVLLPKLSYMLQVTKLPEQALRSIHQPFWGFCKRKLGLASTTSNLLIQHSGILNFKSLHNDLVIKQITSIQKNLSSRNSIEEITRIRIMQGSVNAGFLNWAHITSTETVSVGMWKDNLTCMTLYKAKQMGIDLQQEAGFVSRNIALGTEISRVLLQNTFRRAALSLKSLGLFYLEQLIKEDGRHLLTWGQICSIRRKSKKGRKPNWFKELEQILIEQPETREVYSTYSTQEPNSLTPKLSRGIISVDKRVRESIYVEKNSQLRLGRVFKKRKKDFCVEHWIPTKETDVDHEIGEVKKCENCELNENAIAGSCSFRSSYKKVHGILPQHEKLREGRQCIISSDMFEDNSQGKLEQYYNTECHLENIETIEDLEIELIMDRVYNVNLGLELIANYLQIANSNRRDLYFYTDGSYTPYKPSMDGQLNKMGFGWIQTNEENGIILQEGFYSGQNWPSSTKSELLAIWVVLLMVPRKSNITIYTDSKAAIDGIERGKKIIARHRWFKVKNYAILVQIVELLQLKEIDLQLKKVESHSNNEGNNKADLLAKKGRRLDSSLELVVDSRALPRGVMYWEDLLVELPTRSFIKLVLNINDSLLWSKTKAVVSLSKDNEETFA